MPMDFLLRNASPPVPPGRKIRTLGSLKNALVSNIRFAVRRLRYMDTAMMHAKAQETQFNSGLGDSSHLLYGLVRAMKPNVCVEIGSARGRSACYIGMALKENGIGKLFAIDPHEPTTWNDDAAVDTFDVIRTNLATIGVTEQVEMLRSYSGDVAKAWNRPIDLIFIDGDHSYEGVKRDWDLFTPHVKEFGLVIFHDTIWDVRPDPRWMRPDMGVPRFVEELRCKGYQVVTLDRDCGVSLVQPTIGGISLAAGTK
jgi:predicted O-methyltransferase YrrM